MIKRQIIDTVFSIFVMFAAVFFFDGAIYVALSFIVSTLFAVIITIVYASKITGYGIYAHFKDTVSIFAIAVIMGIVVFMVGRIDLNVFVSFGLQIVVGVIVYAGLALVLKLEPAMYIIDFLKKK